MRIELFNDTYIKPYIMNKQEKKIMKIVNYNEQIQVSVILVFIGFIRLIFKTNKIIMFVTVQYKNILN